MMSKEALRLIRFAVSGGISTLVYILFVLLLLHYSSLRADLVSLSAYIGALGISYFLQSRFTFQMQQDTPFQVTSFAVASAIGILVSYGMMAILSVQLGLSPLLVTAIICVAIPTMNYFAFKMIVFRKN